jgi:hypothetical protein
MEPRTKRVWIGCAAGCLVPALLLVGSCISFTVWLRAPGKLLEPQVLLDPEAVGYFEARLELDNPGTERFVVAMVELLQSQEPSDQPFVQLLYRWNVSRQERDLRRMFPARLGWTVYPGLEPGQTESIGSLSIQRAGHQLLLADWLMEWGLGRAPAEAVLDYAGERVLVMREDRDGSGDRDGDGLDEQAELAEPSEPGEGAAPWPGDEPRSTFYLFLRGDGAFFATGERAVRRAIDRLGHQGAREERDPSPLGNLVAELPKDRQFRGALLNPNGELLSLLEPILDHPPGGADDAPLEGIDRDAWRRALSRVEVASVSGGFEASGDVVLDLDLETAPEARAELLQALRDTLLRLSTDQNVELEWESRETEHGVATSMRLRDVPSQVRRAWEGRDGGVHRAPEPDPLQDGAAPAAEDEVPPTAETEAAPPS